MKKISPYVLFIALFAMVSCNSDRDSIDLKSINVRVEVKRFDRALFAVNPDNIKEAIPRLSNEFGDFFTLFGEGIIHIGKVDDAEFAS